MIKNQFHDRPSWKHRASLNKPTLKSRIGASEGCRTRHHGKIKITLSKPPWKEAMGTGKE